MRKHANIINLREVRTMREEYITHLTPVSNNIKTGPMPVSTTESKTCPIDCPFIDAGCYAKTGPVSWHWNNVDKHLRGTSFIDFLEKIRNLPKGQIWRHNQAGDLPGDGEHLNATACEELTAANKGRRGFTYTHYNPEKNGNRYVIKAMNKSGFTVNLSGNNIKHALHLSTLNAGPVVTVANSETKGTFKQGGKTFVQCPATRVKPGTEHQKKPQPLTDCARCQLCAVSIRKSIVYFPAHGTQKNKVNQITKEV